jgi:hypothetical protein
MFHQVSNRDLPFLFQQIKDLPASLLWQQRIGAVGTWHP